MKARIFFEPRDIWVGVFWDRRDDGLRLYICIVPCVPILLTFSRDTRRLRRHGMGG